MQTLQEYKCPCCGGAIAFDSTLQKMKCPYCDTEFEMETLKDYDAELQNERQDQMEWETAAGSDWQEGETDGLRSYVCKSCGGEIVGDANTAATACPFCGNPVVMMGQFSGALKPDLVIPFKLDKKAAKAGLMKHLAGKRLLPKIFKEQNHIDEIKGIYVPFWLFDTDVDAQIRYRATRVRTWSDKDYNYTETSHFMAHRGGSIGFEHVPVDGSTKMADDLMESIEPYDFSEAVDFRTAYLAGYLADKYDVTAEASIDRANGEPGFVTYGTTTDTDDETVVTYPYVLGKYQGRIPKVGTFFQFLKSTPGYIVCILVPFLLLILLEGIRCIRLFRKYKAEQQAELQAERDKIEADRAETQRMMQELLAMKAQMAQNGGETSKTDETPSDTTTV